MTKWLPIATAPKDGSTIIAAIQRRQEEFKSIVAFWDNERNGWTRECFRGRYRKISSGPVSFTYHLGDALCDPVYWQPMPNPPRAKKARIAP